MNLSTEEMIHTLIHQTDLSLTKVTKKLLHPYGLAPEQSLILLVLHKEHGLTQNEVAQKLNKDKTNIARMAYKLEQKGMIERLTESGDRRSLKLGLTTDGEKLVKEVINLTRNFSEQIRNGITDQELSQLKEILAKIHHNAENYEQA